MPEELTFMDRVRERFPRWVKCHACNRPIHDHTEEEFRECHGPAHPPHLYEWIERGPARPLKGRPSHPGTRIILRAIAYLDKMYGSEEKEAIELLWERATLPEVAIR